MKRRVEEELWLWKDRADRSPLIIRGARQVGKSYLVEYFGQIAFKNIAVANFEFQPELETAFSSLNPQEIIKRLQIYLNVSIVPGETLLFFDEIQRCPKALMSLRYFKEKLPEQHVIAAGSLLEFVLADEKFSFPVGRVEFFRLGPLSFLEYLEAMGHRHLIEEMENWSIHSPPDEGLHQHCLELVRPYLFIGGMPAVVDLYVKERDFRFSERKQASLMQTYRDDFGKYAALTAHKYLQRVLERAPFLVGHHFQYAKVDQEMRSRELRMAVDQLCHAGLLTRIFATAANGLPLRAEINERKFKVLLLDVGLLQATLGNLRSEFHNPDMVEIHKGALAEQFVGQELIAYCDPYLERKLHFWSREARASSAEVDYVINLEGKIVPIEVKSGTTGRLRSLKRFMEEKDVPLGVRISQHPLSFKDGILSVPFYLIHALPRLIANNASEAVK